MHEHSERQRRIEHRESWELLPWLVNGSLDEAQTQRLQDHLQQCVECRREHEAQLSLQQQIRREESVLYTPHASLRKLMTRIEQDGIAPSPESSPAPAPRDARRMKWLTFAVAAEALGVIVLVGALSWQVDSDRAAPRYSTLSSAPAVPPISPPISPQSPAARVVFAPSLSLAELGELLGSYNAQVIAGPTDAGVYTLAFPAAYDQKEVAAAITRLRANPEVRFAELAVADFGAGN